MIAWHQDASGVLLHQVGRLGLLHVFLCRFRRVKGCGCGVSEGTCDLLRCSTQNFDRLICFSPFSRIQVSGYQQVPLLSLVVGFRCSHEFMCCLLEAVHVQNSKTLAKLTVQANDNAAQ